MKVLVIDNYDSFTYNLVQYLQELGVEVDVKRNDKLTLDEVEAYDKVLLSPGPGIPSEAGLLLKIIQAYAGKKPILGVCLGHQAIGEVFGGELVNLDQVYHGVATTCHLLDSDYLFKGMDATFEIGRYHSWIVNNPLPAELEITARDDQGQIMALRHKEFDLRGVQFHPESVLTPNGKQILKNWIEHQ